MQCAMCTHWGRVVVVVVVAVVAVVAGAISHRLWATFHL